MDTAIDEHATIFRSISHEKPSVVDQITSLGANNEGLSNGIAADLGLRISVRGIEASREACHDSQLWVLVRNFDDALGLYVLVAR
jgi:hypothetical protein